MKVCTLHEFVALPEDTVFSFWQPCVADGLYIKGDSIRHDLDESPVTPDFYLQPLLPRSVEEGSPIPVLANVVYRWGMFDEDQLFAVYEPADILRLIALVTGVWA